MTLIGSAQAEQIALDWKTLGGLNTFERQAITFQPIAVDSFLGFQSGGGFLNLVHTEGATFEGNHALAEIYIRINESWELFGFTNEVTGPPGREYSLSSFKFMPIDFSGSSLSGINFTNSLWGATTYFGMTSNELGTQLMFSTSPVPEPEQTVLLCAGLLMLMVLRTPLTNPSRRRSCPDKDRAAGSVDVSV